MPHVYISLPAIAMAASFLSACHASDSVYLQGPWGHAQQHRQYPRYSAPWGDQLPEYNVPSRAVSSAEGMASHSGAGRVWTEERIVHLEAEVPPASLPAQSSLPVAAPPAAPTNPPSVVIGAPGPSAEQRASPPGASPPGVFSTPRRASSYAGHWKVVDAKGSACKIQLSSVPSLDLYKASTSGCSDAGLRSVNGWSLRESTIILFSRGTAVARLSGEEASLKGEMSGSGRSVSMTR